MNDIDNVIDFIKSMELTEGLRASDKAETWYEYNFLAANEIIKKLGGTVEQKFLPEDGDRQAGFNMMLYIIALMIVKAEKRD